MDTTKTTLEMLKEQAAKALRDAPLFGVYKHAAWRDNAVIETPIAEGGGYVVREMSAAVPYSRMTPVAVYRRRAAAEKRADKLNGRG